MDECLHPVKRHRQEVPVVLGVKAPVTPALYGFYNAAVTDPLRLGAKAVLSAIAQWFVWIKLEWAINATSQGREGEHIRTMEREKQPKKAPKTSLVSRARH